MDKTELVSAVAELFSLTGYKVQTSVEINFREIDIVATEQQGLVRKVILVECADYSDTVGIDKLQTDLLKLDSAREKLGYGAVAMHVSAAGYSSKAKGFALEKGLDVFTIDELRSRMVNFDAYVRAVRSEELRQKITVEYQPTKLRLEGQRGTAKPAIDFLTTWLEGSSRWLTVLGDYGVGKSWMLKKLLYHLMDQYEADPTNQPLPFFIPLQKFTKAFDYKNLILATFEEYGLSGVHYAAFEYLVRKGRIVFLYDSFDEMAQMLHSDDIRNNLKELLTGVNRSSRAIMTSRPTYFESRAERLVAMDGEDGTKTWHPVDLKESEKQTAISRILSRELERTTYARLSDLSEEQRLALFRIVLKDNAPAYEQLVLLFERFKRLESISERAVIARLLTSVAETLATTQTKLSLEDLLPSDPRNINEADVFTVIVANLLQRDAGIGRLAGSDRHHFLRAFAVHLQQKGRHPFAEPNELKLLVEALFGKYLSTSDTPVQMLENFYRACRRHSGLTTEGQYLDTSGNIDAPVGEGDTESRVGFSHNSIREFLVADAIKDYLLNGVEYPKLFSSVVSDVVGSFIADLGAHDERIFVKLEEAYRAASDSRQKEWLFRIIYYMAIAKDAKLTRLLGSPAILESCDLCGLDLSMINLNSARIEYCLLGDSDFRGTDLRQSKWDSSIVERTMFDNASIAGADFTKAEVRSIYVNDEYVTETVGVLDGKDARQWLYSRGAAVHPMDDLNPHLGQPWYDAAREVTRTLEKKLHASHQDNSLAQGTPLKYRDLAIEFVEHLLRCGVLFKVKKTGRGHRGGWIVKVEQSHRAVVVDFAQHGRIHLMLEPFFEKHLSR